MGASKYYDVLLDGILIYSGPIRSAQLVYDSIDKSLGILADSFKHQLVLAFHM